MQSSTIFQTALLFYILFITYFISAEGNYYLKAAKNVPRIGRSNNNKNSNIDEMGKFFMKVSKSVPRIGRRNENLSYGQPVDKRDQLPIWADIAEKFEYDPELLTSPEVLEQLQMGDDPSAYDFDQIRNKRDVYRRHPKFQYM